MKTFSLVSSLALLITMPALSFAAKPFYDYARVVNVEPLTKQVRVKTPRQECWNETVTHHRPANGRIYTPEIFGAILGAAVGRQFGSGRGQDAATVAGAVLGGSIGRDVKHRRHHHGRHYQTVEERCHTVQDVHVEERVTGYRVTYRYHGNTFTTRMNHDPGHQLRVRVGVTPVS